MRKTLTGSILLSVLTCILCLTLPLDAHSADIRPESTASAGLAMQSVAQKTRRTRKVKTAKTAKKKKASPKKTGPVDIPIDIGIGPAVQMVTGPVQDEQTYHTGLKISLAAVIDQALIKSQSHRIPKKYRTLASRLNEVRVRPGPVVLVPDTIYISPEQDGTSMYGANWRLLGIGIPLIQVPRLSVSTGLNVSYAYFGGSDTIEKTHFLRPGLDLSAGLEIPFSKSFLISVGWSSYFYPPQDIGGEIFALGEKDQSIWHIGQGFLKLHFRVPYTVQL